MSRLHGFISLPVGIALSRPNLLFVLATAIIRTYFKIFSVKQEKKKDVIKLLAQSMFDSIADIIVQALQNGDISSTKFNKVLLEISETYS